MNLVKLQDTKLIYINLFLYTNNKVWERETKKNPIYNHSKKNKITSNKLFKEVKNLYSENYKTPMKETEDDTNRWKDTLCSWIERINIVKITVLPEAIYKFNELPIKILMEFFTEQIILKPVQNKKRPWVAKTILREKNGARGNQVPWFQTIIQS